MSQAERPVYEVTFCVDREIADAFDQWLAGHVRKMLDMPGILSADTFELDEEEGDQTRRVLHFYIESENDPEQYFAGPANVMRQSGIDLFGDRFDASHRVLRKKGGSDQAMRSVPSCLNCGTALVGQYCGNCGQRARSRLISIWELLREAFGDLFELDSRLWQTLVPLVVRPGRLTWDYLQGRRARFMPPFRMYLVLSVLFFLIAFFDPREDLSLLFEPTAEPTEEVPAAERPAAGVHREVLEELTQEGIVISEDAPEGSSAEDESGLSFNLSTGEGEVRCGLDDMDSADIPEWLSRRLTPERFQMMCERLNAEGGSAALFDKLLDNTPAALFVLLPLMALVLKVLYPLSRPYYAEHLLFIVHYHAFFFLMLILQILFARFATLVHISEGASAIVLFGASVYIPLYLFLSMQRVYRQGTFMTTVKFVILVISYFVGVVLMIGFAALFAAFSI